jgi:midasin
MVTRKCFVNVLLTYKQRSRYDGPLVEAMKRGQMLLLDEIALAEDAVLERLNSVLESGRTLLLAEKVKKKERV